MGQQQLTKYIILFLLLINNYAFGQITLKTIGVKFDDTLIFQKKTKFIKSLKIAKDSIVYFKLYSWANNNIRNINIKETDSTILRVGFNYSGKMISHEELLNNNDTLISNGIRYDFDDSTGRLRHIYTYKNGEFDGLFQSFYADGNIETTGLYKKGEKTGVWKYYKKDGTLNYKKSYN